MPIKKVKKQAGKSANRASYRVSFLRDAHRLIARGYARMAPATHSTTVEEDITDLLVREINAAIAVPLEPGIDRREIDLARAWLVAAGMVGHLNVADQGRICIERRGRVVPAGRPVVHVGEQGDVGMTAGPGGAHDQGGVSRVG